ncbi:MAG: Na+/H+ antiporter subunit E [Gammaproteobacteria bacterium]|nr:Na+/H+ antiporter subunit E [Gammaproteobacteria bacterium]MDP2139606.1 Na+/H+ antiporter subunit E [Gammaproteobacteria bacterium]MDP2346579.1 Na+/H+ antiporter subunit E [Gammaproteobacteria bacterium]
MKIQTFSLGILLVIFWLLNSGHYTPMILSLGAVSIALVIMIARRMKVVDDESQPLHLAASIPAYYLWLLKELVLSNVDVVTRIWRGAGSISPAMATIRINQTNDMNRVIYANSITLTPGTVTTEVSRDSITVHALSSSSIDALNTGEMEARIRRLDR